MFVVIGFSSGFRTVTAAPFEAVPALGSPGSLHTSVMFALIAVFVVIVGV